MDFAPTGSQSSLRPGANTAPPCTLVIFGAGGDLTKRLLMPSLYNLSSRGLLPDAFRLVGVDRLDEDTQSWALALTETMQSFTRDKTAEFYTPELDQHAWQWLCDRMTYMSGDFARPETFERVKGEIGPGSAILYLAVAARFIDTVVEGAGKAGLLAQREGMFRRVVIEKPFGNDLSSARALNAGILKQGDERQFFRIDHFLGKETVQSIMAVRFANGMFEPLWRNQFVDHVQITAAETVGVESRGDFYEPTGALRDMVPNHLFTLLCMVAMEPPNSFDAEAVRSEKAKLMEAIMPVKPNDVVRGQYTAGEEFGASVLGYRQEHLVSPKSTTETYVAMKIEIENWRWSGVPFYLRTGKRLAGRQTEISVHFKPAPYRMFRDTPVDALGPNVLRLLIDPEQGFETQFDAKVPGPEMTLGRVHTALRYKDFFPDHADVGYETLLYDCMVGDATLFQRADAIEASWTAVQPLLDSWGRGEGTVEAYTAGSQGPDKAAALLARDGRCWTVLA
jgi:glucose-6-phosphate 1-dehydrogenase